MLRVTQDDDACEGFKLFLHDSSYVKIDNTKKCIYAVSLERFTRIKHDPGSILQYIKSKGKLSHTFVYKYSRKYFHKYFLCHLFSGKITKILPHFFFKKNNLSGKRRFIGVFLKQIFLIFLKSPFLALAILINHYLPLYTYFFGQKIKWHDHHYCHALPSYIFSPFSEEKSLVFILDGL